MRKIVLILVAFLLFLIPISTAQAANNCGVNIDPANPGAFPTPESVQGSGWVRIEFKDCTEDIDGQENPQLEISLANYKNAIQSYNSVGTGVVLIVDYASYPFAAQHPAKFAVRAGKIASAFAGTKIVYEIWNEPDLGGMGSGGALSPAAYAALAGPAASAIKGAGGVTITGGLGNGDPNYIAQVRAALGGGWGSFDGVAIHPYGAEPDPTPGSACNLIDGDPYGTLPDFLARTAAAAGGKPIWITEFGVNTPDQSVQAKYISCFYQAAAGKVVASILYTWSEAQGGNWGIVTAGNTKKPSYDAYFNSCGGGGGPIGNQSALILSGGQCSSPLPTPDLKRLTKPCDATIDPEYHPLRPYPFNPCDPLIPRYNELTFQCGNALDAFGSRALPPLYDDEARSLPDFAPIGSMAGLIDPMNPIPPYDGGGQVYKRDEGGRLKVYAVQRIPFDVEVDLTTAQLPVIGSTQIKLDDATSMNNYLSWYLNGTVQHAERKELDDINRLINFSGPLKKLLSQNSQKSLRNIIIDGVGAKDIHDYLVGESTGGLRMSRAKNAVSEIFQNIPLSSMEDVVGETVITVQTTLDKQPNGGEGNGPVEGKSKIFIPPNNANPDNPNSMRLYIKKSTQPGTLPTLDVGSDGRMYLAHLRETLALSNILNDYAHPYIMANPAAKSSVPLGNVSPVSEKAQKYFYGTPDKNIHKGTHDATVVQFGDDAPVYAETNTRNTEIIDNPDSVGDSKIIRDGLDLSGAFHSPPEIGKPIDDLGNALSPHIEVEPGIHQETPNEIYKSHNSVCGLQAIAIPGDNVTDAGGWKIVGRLTYTAIFSYRSLERPKGLCGGIAPNDNACPEWHDCVKPGMDDFCRGTDPANMGACARAWAESGGECKKKGPIPIGTGARTTVITETPFIENIYGTLISDKDSVMRRFLPQKNPALLATNTCSYEYLLGEAPYDNPKSNPVDSCVKNASTQVYYEYGENQVSRRHPNDPGGGAREQKTIYFPYLGSLYDYFLGAGCEDLNFQNMFRPKSSIKPCVKTTAGTNFKCDPTKNTPTTIQIPACGSYASGTNWSGQLGTITPGPDSAKSDSDRMDNRILNGRAILNPVGQGTGLVDYDGPTDAGAPDFRTISANPGQIASVYRLDPEFDQCIWPVNFMGLNLGAGSPIKVPQANYFPFGAGTQATVTYASCNEITLVYANYDGIQFQNGTSGPYTVHMVGLNVDRDLVAAYNSARGTFGTNHQLPYVRVGQQIGVAGSGQVYIGIRDTGQLMDPRSRKDWWQ